MRVISSSLVLLSMTGCANLTGEIKQKGSELSSTLNDKTLHDPVNQKSKELLKYISDNNPKALKTMFCVQIRTSQK